jgi:hypothetical protein
MSNVGRRRLGGFTMGSMSQAEGLGGKSAGEPTGLAIPWAERTPEERTRWHRDQHTNKTGFLGVTWKERDRRFVARIRVPGRADKIHCGVGRTAVEAARRYDAKARELFGARAVTNFPE